MAETHPVMTDEQLVTKLVEHGEWMVKSGQCGMTVMQYLECLRYRDDELREAVLAEARRRQNESS